jgi:hypothetical protein
MALVYVHHFARMVAGSRTRMTPGIVVDEEDGFLECQSMMVEERLETGTVAQSYYSSETKCCLEFFILDSSNIVAPKNLILDTCTSKCQANVHWKETCDHCSLSSMTLVGR